MDIHNIYNQIQVMLLMKQDDLEEAPDFDDVFREDEVNYFLIWFMYLSELCNLNFSTREKEHISTAISFVWF